MRTIEIMALLMGSSSNSAAYGLSRPHQRSHRQDLSFVHTLALGIMFYIISGRRPAGVRSRRVGTCQIAGLITAQHVVKRDLLQPPFTNSANFFRA